MLLGRGKELEYLNQYYLQDENRMIVLYGQKSIGVTGLTDSFVKGKNAVSLYACPSGPRQSSYLWTKELEAQGISFSEEYPDFETLFYTIMEQRALRASGKLVICIHQFQNLVRTDVSLLTALSAVMREERYRNSVMIILAGNAIGYVENSMISQLGPLALQISAFVKLKPLRFLDLVCFFDSSNTRKCMNIYSITGGNPGYWGYFNMQESFKENICRLFLQKDSPFYDVGIREVSEHLRELNVYATLLATLAEGREKMNEIHLHTGYSRPKISVYLKNLMAHEYVEKVFSYEAPGEANVKKGVYRISNPMLQFWFRFIYPHMGEIGAISPDDFYEKYIAEDIATHTGKYFCRVCSEYLSILNEKNCLPFVYTRCGEWVGKHGTIDIVAQNAKRDTLLGFCNYEFDGMSYEDYEKYLACAKQAYLKPMYCYLFSVTGFDERLERLAKENDTIQLVDMSQL